MAAILSAATGRTIRHVRVPADGLVEAMSDYVAAVTGRQPRSLAQFTPDELATHAGALVLAG